VAIKKRETNTRGEPYDDGKPRYEVRLRGPDGKAISKTFPRRDAAARWEREKLRERDRGEWVEPSAGRLTLSEYAEQWERQVVHLEQSTRRIYSDNLRLHIVPDLGDVPLGRLTTELLREWLSALMAKPNTRRKMADDEAPRPALSPASVHQAYRTLHRVLETAVDDDRIGRNPLAGVKPPKVAKHEMRFLTHDEVRSIIEVIDERYRALVLVASYCGLRAGELRGLRRRNVDLLTRSMTVSQQLIDGPTGPTFGDLKTAASRRSVPIPLTVATALQHHLDNFSQPGPDGLVFPGPAGGPLRLEHFRRRQWAPACTKAGVGHLRIHDMRHTCASLAIAAGADLKVLQRMLGHASAAMTLDRYGHLMPGQGDEVANRLDIGAQAAQAKPRAKVVPISTARHARDTTIEPAAEETA
jgi:integrase